MGLTYAPIEIINGDDIALAHYGYRPESSIRKMTINALVDSGALSLAINEDIKNQLGLKKVDERLAELADGSQVKLEVVGPVEINFQNRRAVVDAMVLPGNAEVLLGAIPMESMDVLIDPRNQQLIVNPESPYIPKGKLK